jgi:hypothetical protein
MNTRKDSQGNKVLFLEEIQSDWGQKGKREGFVEKLEPITKNNSTIEKINDRESDFAYKLNYKGKDLAFVFNDEKHLFKNQSEIDNVLIHRANRDYARSQQDKTPSAPFVMDTNAWTKLALKVALKEAVKQGVDKLAWTTGEQQVGRYEDDFRKQVDKIETESKKAYGSVYVIAYKNGNVVFENDMPLEGKTNIGGREVDLEDVVGKEIANKIRTGEQKQNFEGKDLTIGGKGMEDFYGKPSDAIRSKNFTIKKEGELFAVTDENGKTIRTFKQENEAIKFKENYGLGIVGNVAKSLFKQEPKTVKINTGDFKDTPPSISKSPDGQKFGVTNPFPNEEGKVFDNKQDAMNYLRELNIRYEKALKSGEFSNSTQHSIDITPELKQQVSEGLPLFMASVPKEDFAEALNEYDNLIKNPKATTEYIKKFGLEKIKKIKDITSNFGTYIAALEKSNYITKKIC